MTTDTAGQLTCEGLCLTFDRDGFVLAERNDMSIYFHMDDLQEIWCASDNMPGAVLVQDDQAIYMSQHLSEEVIFMFQAMAHLGYQEAI